MAIPADEVTISPPPAVVREYDSGERDIDCFHSLQDTFTLSLSKRMNEPVASTRVFHIEEQAKPIALISVYCLPDDEAEAADYDPPLVAQGTFQVMFSRKGTVPRLDWDE